MVGIGGPDETVVRDPEGLLQSLESVGVACSQVADVDALFDGRLLHLQAVLVRPGEEHDVEPVESLESGDDVRRDVLVGVADVRGTVRVRDGCGDIEGGP